MQLDFGSTAFNGEARYLQTGVKCAGDSVFNTLSPRQMLSAAPYALGLKPGAIISNTEGTVLTIYNRNSVAYISGIYVDVGEPELYSQQQSKAPFGIAGGNAIGIFSQSSTVGVMAKGNVAGLYGGSSSGDGMYGWTNTGNGVHGKATRAEGYAGYFDGKVHINGTLSKSAGGFKIDHPLDPANQYLSHSFVESPDMMNVYNGNITTDANGEAIVILPDYFEALNRDFRYQLTVIGEFAQVIVAEEIQDNRFTIKTDKPNVKVSWQVTGIRHDPYAEQNRIPVEEDKPANERGTYLYPQGYGMPITMTVNYVAPESMEQ